jgi:hypothetical protein
MLRCILDPDLTYDNIISQLGVKVIFIAERSTLQNGHVVTRAHPGQGSAIGGEKCDVKMKGAHCIACTGQEPTETPCPSKWAYDKSRS